MLILFVEWVGNLLSGLRLHLRLKGKLPILRVLSISFGFQRFLEAVLDWSRTMISPVLFTRLCG
jgi:hypothetical protein